MENNGKFIVSASIDKNLEDKMNKQSINKTKLVNTLLNNFVDNQELIKKYKENK